MGTGAAAGADEAAFARALAAVAAAFDLGGIERVEVIQTGLMNRNWKVVTSGGVFVVKQVLDVDTTAARRQQTVTRALAGRGRPRSHTAERGWR